MSQTLVDDLRGRLRDGRVVVVAGSGVTAAATRGHPLSSWSGLVSSGLDWASRLPGVATGRLDAARSLLGVGDASALISSAELVTEALGGRDGGEFARWLRDTVGSLELMDTSVPTALVALGVPVATTNYDGLIEEAADWERVTWLDGAAMQRALQREDRAVVHLHGHWRTARSVILGVRSYEELAVSGPAQGLQRAMATMNSLMFVGVGDGASDPNFLALRTWLAATFAGSEYRHYRLCLDGEVDALSAEHGPAERIVAVGYGDSHDKLADFLGDLATVPRSHAQVGGTDSTRTAAITGLPARPVTVGRDDELAEVVGHLLSERPQPTLLHGAPGIGKTNLTLAALHSAEVVARFGARRWLVRCEALVSAAGMAGGLAAALGVVAGDVLAGVIARLSEAPSVVALDNLETPWEADTLAVEELLGVIANIAGVALVASLRGAERPGGIRWRRPTQLEPLDLRVAKSLFLSIAPERFDASGLDELLEEMGGIPLAVELLAHAAEGEASLDGLAQRWREERVRLLTRGTADHRLLSIAVSIDTSWSSPAMSEPARRLLSAMGQLPDGVAHDDLELLLPGEGPAAANQLRGRGLVLDQAGRLRTLPPVRHHLADTHLPQESDWQRAIAHYCRLSETLGELAGRLGGGEAIVRLGRETANITATVKQVLAGGQPEQGYAAARAFITAAQFSGLDAALIAEALVLAAHASGDAIMLADTSVQVGHLALARSDHDAASEAFEQALPLYRGLGDVLGEANCIKGLGDIAYERPDHDAASEAYEQALHLYREVSITDGEANCIKALGDIALARADHDAASEAYEQALHLYREIGDVLGEANCILSLGDVALERSDDDAASEAYEQALHLYTRIEEPYSIGQARRRLARLAKDPIVRCEHVSAAREAWSTIRRHDLVAELEAEFADCDG